MTDRPQMGGSIFWAPKAYWRITKFQISPGLFMYSSILFLQWFRWLLSVYKRWKCQGREVIWLSEFGLNPKSEHKAVHPVTKAENWGSWDYSQFGIGKIIIKTLVVKGTSWWRKCSVKIANQILAVLINSK